MSGSHILEATTEQYGKQIEELRTEMERLKIDNQLLGNGCDHFRTRAEAAEGKVEEEMKNKAVFGPPPWSINEAQADLIKKQNATIARLREEVERLKAQEKEHADICDEALRVSVELSRKLEAAEAKVERAKKFLKGCGAVKLTDKQIDELFEGEESR